MGAGGSHHLRRSRWASLDQPGFVLAFGLACAVTFAGTLAVRLGGGRPLADATLDGLNAAYANSGFIGFPLCLVLFGPASLPLVTVATILTACVLFAIAIILIQAGLQRGRQATGLVWSVGASLLRNPLLVAPGAGATVAAAGLPIPDSVESFLKLLSAAASPAALVALGSFLAEERQGQASYRIAGSLVVLKLLLQPALAWALAWTLGLPPGLVKVVVLLSALPTGTGPFMLAELHGREAAVTSSTILASTVLSLGTVTLLLAALG